MGGDRTKAGTYLGQRPVSATDTVPAIGTDATVDAADGREASVFELLPRNRYADLGRLGAGGMGDVHRVEDLLMGRVLAMKVLSWELLESVSAKERFLNEARITSRLQHPAIIAVHDMGVLPDGRPWFTMKEVRGRTLREVIAELHEEPALQQQAVCQAVCQAEPPDTERPHSEPSGVAALNAPTAGHREARRVTLRRVMQAMVRICEALAYAHSHGVIHRDIKPANLMVGDFGEVLVMDWGLALELTEGCSTGGEIAGTLHYMSPEQLRGEPLTPACDVYALGAILYQIMTGAPPHAEAAGPRARKVLTSEPVAPIEPDDGSQRPAALCAIAMRALTPDVAARYPDAGALLAELRDFLDDAQRRERGLLRVQHADAQWPAIEALLDQERAMRAEANRLLDGVRPYDPQEKKEPAWQLQDDADKLARQASVAEVTWQQTLRAALEESPDLPEAHERLADYYHRRLEQAQAARDDTSSTRAEALLRIHDRGRYRRYLRGEGMLTLVTDPPGARARIFRYEEEKRVLVPKPVGELAATPVFDKRLPHGSYLLEIDAPGRRTTRYPVLIERDQHWDGVRPGDEEPFAIRLLSDDELGADDVYVPAGWFWSGGDPQAIEPLPRRRIWLDGFVMRRHPVTYGEYLAFLNALALRGGMDGAHRLAPQPLLGGPINWDRERVLRFDDTVGQFVAQRPDCLAKPVSMIDWHAARRYAQFAAQTTAQHWRLPFELEWEKAARGVDGRFMPWGDHFETTRACVVDSHTDNPDAVSIERFEQDESCYGIRGMAGNVRDWCQDIWSRDGGVTDDSCAVGPPVSGAEEALRLSRGGAWTSTVETCRLTSRFAGKSTDRYMAQGMRLCATLGRRQ